MPMPTPIKEQLRLMRRYAREGVKDWTKNQPASLRDGVVRSLVPIADNDHDADVIVNSLENGIDPGRRKLVPAPLVHHAGIEQCFFLPLRDGMGRASFALVMAMKAGAWIGFRFELAEQNSSTHGYSHAQLVRQLRGFGDWILPGCPEWLPDSYPAIPLPTSDPFGLFLCLAIAIHGYPDGMRSVLGRIFADRPQDKVRYQQRVDEIAGVAGAIAQTA